mmetsp:Transcript_97754/g.209739  ORF Transcript_97754/g.209739 Transcript_97754/m.209739 type:complete len:256 (+) Transcript_97754:77-844(+)
MRWTAGRPWRQHPVVVAFLLAPLSSSGLLLRGGGNSSAVASLLQESTVEGQQESPSPYLIWVHQPPPPGPTPIPLPEQCFGCDCLTPFPQRFVVNGKIADGYKCRGGVGGSQGASTLVPVLAWSGLQEGRRCPDRRSFAVTVEDLDYPHGVGAEDNRVHGMFWVANIPGNWHAINAARLLGRFGKESGVMVGRNVLGTLAMEPVCPRGGEHRYKITIWALNSPDLGAVTSETSYAKVLEAIQARELARATVFARS